MLIKGGYVYSLKALLDKGRAEERELAARRARRAASGVPYAIRVVDWVVGLWTWWQPKFRGSEVPKFRSSEVPKF